MLADLVAWFDAAGVRGAVIGGIAASVHGRPRATRDVDAVVIVPDDAVADALATGRAHGFEPRIDDPMAFARRSRVLLLRHGPSAIDVDVSLGGLPFEHETVARARSTDVAGVAIPLATPEDVIVMKAVANRDRDRADIEAIVRANPRLDRRRIRRWVGEFARTLEMPELLDGVARALAGGRKRKPR